jgi:hypothetical protein
MSLTMLLRHRIVELEGLYTCASHKEERDVLNVFDIFWIGVLCVMTWVRN